MEDNSVGPSKVLSLQSTLQSLDNKLDNQYSQLVGQLIANLPDSEIKEKELMKKQFLTKEKGRIDTLLINLSSKVKDMPGSQITPSVSVCTEKKEQTFLKKIDPPRWEGDPVEFSEFARKWKSQVSTANLPPESELDRLRDSIPAQASKALFGESCMKSAWKILENLYGDKDLIANKLKTQLKSIKGKGRTDSDLVIDLVTDVNNIILRLKAIEMEEALHVDSEFLAAVFRALPNHNQTKWLEYDKTPYRSKWAAFIKFLESAREQAVQKKVLLASYESDDPSVNCRNCGGNGHLAKRCPSNSVQKSSHVGVSSAIKTQSTDSDSKQDREKVARSECGLCPLCDERHTFYNAKEKDMWPSDRMFRCETFKNLGVKDRADTLEKYKCCSRCTSWNHRKDTCKVASKCRNIVGNKVCGGSHSSFVCGSGSAYCGALGNPYSCSDNLSIHDCSEFPNLNAETLLLFQEVAVAFASEPANLCWDNGSSRCLITHSYARKHGLLSQEIVFSLDVVGSKGKPKQGYFYIFDLVQNDGLSLIHI